MLAFELQDRFFLRLSLRKKGELLGVCGSRLY